jgi:HD-GYP domain-containing protein (c-di-GMP phosphodiesterase class II)
MEHPVLKEAEDFDNRFPKLVKTLDNFEKIIDIEQLRRKYFSNKDKKGKDYFREIITEFYDQERENVESQFEDELNEAMPDHWKTLGSYNWGCITLHTLNVVYRTVRDPLYSKLSKSEQNILKWAALLHDIVKRGDPLF